MTTESEATETPSKQPIGSLTALWIHLGKPPRNANDWRLIQNARRGMFRALPQLAGVELATDGCVLVLLSENGSTASGHITNFIPFQEPKAERDAGGKSKPSKPSKLVLSLLE